jgi:hypothetical protein
MLSVTEITILFITGGQITDFLEVVGNLAIVGLTQKLSLTLIPSPSPIGDTKGERGSFFDDLPTFSI